MKTQHEEMIVDAAELQDLAMGTITVESAAEMITLLDRLDENLTLRRAAAQALGNSTSVKG
nr:hypothetical protein [Brevundimonas diminuta]